MQGYQPRVALSACMPGKNFNELDDSIDFDQGSKFTIAIASDDPLMLLQEICSQF
jgi:hypothetical protein